MSAVPPHTPGVPPVEIVCSAHFLAWLHNEGVSLATTACQSNRLFLFGIKPDGSLSAFERQFDRPMGLAATPGRLTMATRSQLWTLDDVLAPAGNVPRETDDGFDALFVPRTATTTGELNVHDVAIGEDGRPVFVNTLYSCLATTEDRHSFRALWTPPFISALVPEERCHLNGLAMRAGRATFATSVSRSDVAAGWRERRTDGGVVLSVIDDAVVLTGLSMPHAPRWHDEQLYVLNSGTGELGRVEIDGGRFEPVAFVPGYARGLSFYGRWAVVGVSKMRDERAFTGLPLDKRLAAKDAVARCGLYVVDLTTGHVAHWLQFEGPVTELYDVQVLPGIRRPKALGFKTDEIRRLITFTHGTGLSRHTLPPRQGEVSPPPVADPGPTLAPPPSAPAGFTFALGAGSLVEARTRFDALLPVFAETQARQRHVHEPLIGVTAQHNGQHVGLALADLAPKTGKGTLVSLFVDRARHNQGVGTALLERVEVALAAQNARTVEATYKTSWPLHGAFERVLRKRGWEAPRTVRLLVKMEMARLRTAPWLRAAEWPLPEGHAVFPWAELTDAERTDILDEQARAPWFPDVLTPFQMEAQIEPACSLGLRVDGQVAGWCITHRLQPNLIQYTSLFVREGVPKGRLVSLLAQAVCRQMPTGVPLLACMIDADNAEMRRFAARRLGPDITSQAEVRVAAKRLAVRS